jgi:hypothetical protein
VTDKPANSIGGLVYDGLLYVDLADVTSELRRRAAAFRADAAHTADCRDECRHPQ